MIGLSNIIQQRCKNDAAAEQEQQTVPVARDVLMALAAEIRDAVILDVTRDNIVSITGAVVKRAKRIDLNAIVDRYAAQPPAVAVPDGYKLVPVEPTAQMIEAGFGRDDENCKFWRHPAQAYRAMLAAAPKAATAFKIWDASTKHGRKEHMLSHPTTPKE